jgi:diacylglycerol kinase (ATP)
MTLRNAAAFLVRLCPILNTILCSAFLSESPLIKLRYSTTARAEVNLENPHKSKSGMVRIWRAFFYSLEGFSAALRHEHAFRQEIFLAVILLPFAIFLPLTLGEKALLIATLLLVLVVELLNSAIEAVVDRVGLENHELSKRAKDLGSAAVFLSCAIVLTVWGCVAGPAIFKLF